MKRVKFLVLALWCLFGTPACTSSEQPDAMLTWQSLSQDDVLGDRYAWWAGSIDLEARDNKALWPEDWQRVTLRSATGEKITLYAPNERMRKDSSFVEVSCRDLYNGAFARKSEYAAILGQYLPAYQALKALDRRYEADHSPRTDWEAQKEAREALDREYQLVIEAQTDVAEKVKLEAERDQRWREISREIPDLSPLKGQVSAEMVTERDRLIAKLEKLYLELYLVK